MLQYCLIWLHANHLEAILNICYKQAINCGMLCAAILALRDLNGVQTWLFVKVLQRILNFANHSNFFPITVFMMSRDPATLLGH